MQKMMANLIPRTKYKADGYCISIVKMLIQYTNLMDVNSTDIQNVIYQNLKKNHYGELMSSYMKKH